MGESPNQPFQLSFDASLKIHFQGSRVTSDGGLILVRELDERVGFGELIQQHLTDSRRGKNTQVPLADLLRQSVYSRLPGSKTSTMRRGFPKTRPNAPLPLSGIQLSPAEYTPRWALSNVAWPRRTAGSLRSPANPVYVNRSA